MEVTEEEKGYSYSELEELLRVVESIVEYRRMKRWWYGG
jgi:hypothetical protein